MKKTIAFFFFAISLNTHALVVPQGSGKDSRIQSVVYSPVDVVRVNHIVGTVSQVIFADDEVIEQKKVMSGFTSGWSITPVDNTLYIKAIELEATEDAGNNQQKKVMLDPIPAEWDTNLTVTTNKKTYHFDLKLVESSKPASYFIKFLYPDDERKKAEAEARRIAEEKRKEELKPDMVKVPKPKNEKYKYKAKRNSTDIQPLSVYDDGEFTYFEFKANGAIPAIFSIDQQKVEHTINKHIDPKMPNTVVVHTISREFVLRMGKAAVGIFNQAFDTTNSNETGTTVSGAERVMKGEADE